MFKKNLLIIGAGGHANSVIDIVETSSEWKVGGIIGNDEEVGKRIGRYKVIGSDRDLGELKRYYKYIFIGIGQIKSPEKRIYLAKEVKNLGYKSPILISKHAYVSNTAQLSEGVLVGHGAIVNCGAVIGKHSIINSMALVEHGCRIGEFCHISTASTINGDSKVGNGCFVGSNSMVRESIEIPMYSIIPAGSKVMK